MVFNASDDYDLTDDDDWRMEDEEIFWYKFKLELKQK